LSFYWDAFGIEGMVREKMISSSFGGLQALNADTWCWGWQALGAKPNPRVMWGHLALGLPCLCAGSDPRAWLQTLVRPKAHGSSVKTQFS